MVDLGGMQQQSFEELFSLLTSPVPAIFIPGMDRELIKALNEWRLRQIPPLEPNEAILKLLRASLGLNPPLVVAQDLPDKEVEKLVAAFKSISSKTGS